ncbi:MAG: hypothetical protein ACE5H8_13945 [Alphaproteobacteria bacterium]
MSKGFEAESGAMKGKQDSIRRARRWLAHILDPDDAEGTCAPAGKVAAHNHKPPAPSPGTSPNARLAELEKRLARFLATVNRDGKPVTTGAIQLIGLATIRDRLGDKWERFSDRVHGTARSVIEQHLSDSDVYSLYRDESYIILFAQATEEQGRFKAKVIGDEISHRLFGGAATADAIAVKTLVYQVDGALGLEDADDGTLLDRLLTQAHDHYDEQTGRSPSPASRAKAPADADSSPFKLVYRPIWTVRKNAVTDFVATLGQGKSAFVDGVPPATSDVDLFVLKDVIRGVREIEEGAAKKVFVAPVHLSTLSNSHSRREYFDLCRTVSEKARRYMTFELVIPDDPTVLFRVDNVSLQLRSFTRSLMCRVGLDFNSFEFFENHRFFAIGMSLPSSRYKESDIMARLETFSAMTKRHGVEGYLHNVPSLSLMSFAVAAGFDYLSGEPIGSVTRAQVGAYRFSIEDLYSAMA